MKRELIEKIYKQKFECEKEIDRIDKIKNIDTTKNGQYLYGQQIGRKIELGENIVFCEELLDIIVKDE